MSVNPDLSALAVLLEGELATSPDDTAESDPVRQVVMDALGAHWGGAVEHLAEESTLVEDGDLDTIALYAVVAQVEQELKIALPDREVEGLKTVAELIEACRAQR